VDTGAYDRGLCATMGDTKIQALRHCE